MTDILTRRSVPIAVGLMFGLLAIAAALLAGNGASEQALFAARWTARAALPLFLAAFLGSALVRLWPGAVTRAVRLRRRQWGLGFALAHTIHLAALLINICLFRPRPLTSLAGGAIVYAFILAMALTSNDAMQRRMGRGWTWLHLIGAYAIWTAFFAAYAGRAVSDDVATQVVGWFFGLVLAAALVLRIIGRRGSRVIEGR